MVVDKVDVKVTGPGATEKVFTDITNDLPVQAGDTLNHSNYDSLKGSLLRTAATYGYLDARMVRNEMRVDPQAYVAQVTIEFETGPRYKFGATTITQSTIDDALVQRFLRYKAGDPFDASQLLRTQFALDDSQYFATVEVLPEERDREQLTVPVSITADPNRRHRYSFGVGYGTDTQVRGTVAWEVRRMNSRGHRFRTEARGSALSQSLDARYIIPIGDPATEKFTLQLTAEHERRADVDDRTVDFIPSLTHLRHSWFGEHYWQRVTYVEFLHTESEFVASGRNNTQSLLIPGISFGLVPSNYLGEALFSRTLYAELRGSHTALGSDSDFLQLRVQGERVFDFAPKWHVLLRGDIGATAVSSTTGLAPSQRFFAGGDRSVRGFAVNELSPVEPVIDLDTGLPVYERRWHSQARKGRRQTPVCRSRGADTRPAEELRHRCVHRCGQRLRQLRRSADVFGGTRRTISPAGGFGGYRRRAGADHPRGRDRTPGTTPAPEFLAETLMKRRLKIAALIFGSVRPGPAAVPCLGALHRGRPALRRGAAAGAPRQSHAQDRKRARHDCRRIRRRPGRRGSGTHPCARRQGHGARQCLAAARGTHRGARSAL